MILRKSIFRQLPPNLQGFIGIKCVIRQFSASQDHIVDMIFEQLEFLVEVQTEKTEKVPQKTEKKTKKPKNTEKYRKKPNATANLKFGTGFFRFFFGFFGLQPPQLLISQLTVTTVEKIEYD